MPLFSRHERTILARIAETVIPAGEILPGGGEVTVERAERYLARMPAWLQATMRATLWLVETAAVPLAGRPFSRLDAAARERLLEGWRTASNVSLRHSLRGVLTLVKGSHFDDASVFQALGCNFGVPPVSAENPRWLAQVTDGREVKDDETLEADVVIVGSGAGGAALAYELAARGHAVLMIEEGRYFRRHEFTGRAPEMTQRMFRDNGLTVALGNIAAPVWAGCTVGGSTTVNSGTCYRTPERTFRVWRERLGLEMFSSDAMGAYFDRVEGILGVAPARTQYLGGVARVIARGADAMGYVHGPLRRNAPDCDGQGLCVFGCPTGAKRSADVSYVPMALERGAALVASAKVTRVLADATGARGVVARCAGGGTYTVHAKMTVVAAGALMTPVLLLENGLANRSGMLGRNLSIHPAAKVLGLFDERIEMDRAIPQGYCIEQFAEDGIMFEGASTPLDVTALGLPLLGRRFTEVIERYAHLASFGFMIQDTSRGRVRAGPGGRPVITYALNDHDVARMKRAVEVLSRVFFAAGARRVYPSVHGFDELTDVREVDRFARARVRAGDLEITAYHPLGTARMGRDPARSVVGPDHQCHDVPNLYVVDGAAVPTALGVNPQVTIMAMATRAAEIMDARLSGDDRARPGPSAEPKDVVHGWA